MRLVFSVYKYLWPIPYSFLEWSHAFHHFHIDYSRYGYLYLIHDKSQSLDMFKTYNAELKINWIERRLKLLDLTVVMSTMTNTMDQTDVQWPFASFLKEYSIVPQYTILEKSRQNGIAERWNHILNDMVRSIIAHTTLPESL